MWRRRLWHVPLILYCATATSFVHNCHHSTKASIHHLTLNNEERHTNDCNIHLVSDLRRTSYSALLNKIPSHVKIVLIGEGTHGTEEFTQIRSEITQCLIQQQQNDSIGFKQYAIICEADVQPFHELNKFITTSCDQYATTHMQNNNNVEKDDNGNDVGMIYSTLSKLFHSRFPDWMWANKSMSKFVSWLRGYNARRNKSFHDIQFVGMDIQSSFESMDYINQQLLNMKEEELAVYVRQCYEPLLKYRHSTIRRYGNDVYGNKIASQQCAVKDALNALVERHNATIQSKIFADDNNNIQQLRKDWWNVIHNGHVIVASEAYHRQRIHPGHSTTWNVRTRGMMDSILRCFEHMSQANNNSCTAKTASNEDEEVQAPMRCIVWAHNSHVGDMRSTGYASLGQVSLGQLCREIFGNDNVFLIGMTMYEGSVRAASADITGACWQGKGELMKLRKATDDSHEAVLHSIAKDHIKSDDEEKAFGLYLKEHQELFNCSRLERFVGSCYLPQTEMMSHYTQCIMASQFDFIFHVDNSSAVVV